MVSDRRYERQDGLREFEVLQYGSNLIHAESTFHQIPSLVWLHLNPVEDVWNTLKNRLDRRCPRPGADQMKAAVLEEWGFRIVADSAVGG